MVQVSTIIVSAKIKVSPVGLVAGCIKDLLTGTDISVQYTITAVSFFGLIQDAFRWSCSRNEAPR